MAKLASYTKSHSKGIFGINRITAGTAQDRKPVPPFDCKIVLLSKMSLMAVE
jgi:hypothetical protein